MTISSWSAPWDHRDQLVGIAADADEDLLVHVGHAVGRLRYAWSRRIVADALKDEPNALGDLVVVEHGHVRILARGGHRRQGRGGPRLSYGAVRYGPRLQRADVRRLRYRSS